jgi:membrane protein YdbS with pleckstrin-like domain
MTEINPRNTPIALVLGGAIIIGISVYAYAFGQHTDSFLTWIVAVAFVIGVVAILLGGALYYWERSKYYDPRRVI